MTSPSDDHLEEPSEIGELLDLRRLLKQIHHNYLDRPLDYRGPQIRAAVRDACGELTLGWDEDEAGRLHKSVGGEYTKTGRLFAGGRARYVPMLALAMLREIGDGGVACTPFGTFDIKKRVEPPQEEGGTHVLFDQIENGLEPGSLGIIAGNASVHLPEEPSAIHYLDSHPSLLKEKGKEGTMRFRIVGVVGGGHAGVVATQDSIFDSTHTHLPAPAPDAATLERCFPPQITEEDGAVRLEPRQGWQAFGPHDFNQGNGT